MDIAKVGKLAAVGAVAAAAADMVENSKWYEEKGAEAKKANPEMKGESTTQKAARYGAAAAVVVAAHFAGLL